MLVLQSTSRGLPCSSETKMREHFMAELGQMRIATMAGIGPCVDDLGLDVCGALAQHDDSAGEKQRLLNIVGYEQRSEARPLPQRYELALHCDPRSGVELTQRFV